MKKNALVQLVVIYVGIMAMYAGLNTLVTDLIVILVGVAGRDYGQSNLMIYVIVYLIIPLIGFIAITKSANISEFIVEKSGLDDTLKIYTKPQQLLSILIVVLALGHLLDHLPVFIHDVLFFFTNSLGGRRTNGLGEVNEGNPNGTKWLVNILHLLLPCLMIIFCRQLTAYFSKNIMLDDKDIVAEHETITIETTDNV